MHVYMYEYMVHPHILWFWRGGGDRDEGQAGFLIGEGVLLGRGICDRIFKLISLKTFNI